jgi:release factor glutamine methyltransferase
MRRDRSIVLNVLPQVYSPAEDTFLLLSALDVETGERALEMGCGSGLLSLHMAKAGANVTAVDVDPHALLNTEQNADQNRLQIETVLSDLFQDVDGQYDIIVFNPPYLRGCGQGQEDLCWAGGDTGVEVMKEFLDGARKHLAPGGRVLLLVSSDVEPGSLASALSGWNAWPIASKNLFFEELKVLELTF